MNILSFLNYSICYKPNEKIVIYKFYKVFSNVSIKLNNTGLNVYLIFQKIWDNLKQNTAYEQ